MALTGTRHLIECHCVLPQYRNTSPVVYHKFVVFSLLDDDAVQSKLVQCNNCGIVHKVIDICKSEIVHGIEEGNSLRTIGDIKFGLPERIATFLEQQNVDISIWELVEFLLDTKADSEVVISKDERAGITQLKILQLKPDGSFKVKSESRQDEVVF